MTSNEADLDQLLALEPRNIDGLVRKGELRAAAADHRAATAFYKAALAAASRVKTLSATDRPAIDRALVGIEHAQRIFLEYLEQSLTIGGFGPGSRPPRLSLPSI